jgi:hypothetical protein
MVQVDSCCALFHCQAVEAAKLLREGQYLLPVYHTCCKLEWICVSHCMSCTVCKQLLQCVPSTVVSVVCCIGTVCVCACNLYLGMGVGSCRSVYVWLATPMWCCDCCQLRCCMIVCVTVTLECTAGSRSCICICIIGMNRLTQAI